jgi:hypothetical protein
MLRGDQREREAAQAEHQDQVDPHRAATFSATRSTALRARGLD